MSYPQHAVFQEGVKCSEGHLAGTESSCLISQSNLFSHFPFSGATLKKKNNSKQKQNPQSNSRRGNKTLGNQIRVMKMIIPFHLDL